MRNLEEIFDIYLMQFKLDTEVAKIKNRNVVVTEEDIFKSIEKTFDLYGKELDIELNDIEKQELIRRIKASYTIYQEEGSVILGDYNHDYNWYKDLLNNQDFKQFFWLRYKDYLQFESRLPDGIIKTLENDTLYNLMSYIGNPNDSETTFSVRGLVVGDVQSGKTSNYIGLITKAVDAGYKVIFVLTGTIESLRKQTQKRVEEGFVGFDSVDGVDVGVGRGDIVPRIFTSRDKDFTGKDDQNTNSIINSSSEPMIYVLKKNVSVLKKVHSALKRINTRYDKEKIDCPVLVIDDEADNASINTNEKDVDPTKINEQIRKILSLFTRTSYVGFTATPFANVFISYDSEDDMLKDDLFPRDFIYALYAPSNYCGSRKYFFEKNENVRFITDDNQQIFPMRHTKDYIIDKLYPSVYHAVNTFLLANAIRDTYDNVKNTHRSMMINMSRFKDVQLRMVDEIEDYVNKVKKNIKQSIKLDSNLMDKNPFIYALKKSFSKEFKNIKQNHQKVVWKEIVPNLYSATKDIDVIAVNSTKSAKKLDYDKYKNTGYRVIAIGGLALSRGLTLEGLCVSYFYRNTATYDVLMQMGRWFGYRDDYDSLCKIFITKKSSNYYKSICESIEQLKRDIDNMGKEHKKPEEYGIRVRNDSAELGITARNKMRDTSLRIERKSYYGNFFETPYLFRDLSINKKNILATERFFADIKNIERDKSIIHPYYRNIPKEHISKLLNSIKIHPACLNFDTLQIRRFLSKNNQDLNKFDVLIMGGFSKKNYENKDLNISVQLVTRQFDIRNDEEIIRINAQRAHLIGRSDARYGLDSETLNKIEIDNPKTQDYMPKGRNPLLAIYFLEPNNSKRKFTSKYDTDTANEMLEELNKMDKNYLVGYCLFFPKNENNKDDSLEFYFVNNKVNYYEKMHDEDQKLGLEEEEEYE
ncbi:MAG: Z1 domain-containing protein [Erysipelotrichaceae bacterium]|nr:Z1 domain-containing protein [Erysipelotrichaceae bacterium]